MIDLHCHVLAGLDDGPTTLGDSVEMMVRAAAAGIGIVCATPHIRADHDVVIREIAERVDEVNDSLPPGLPSRLVPGGEVGQLDATKLDSDELLQVSLGGGGRWILLEPAPGPITQELVDIVEHLHQRGFRSLIAHPERHLGEGLLEHLAEACNAGALVQVTASTLTHPSTMSGMAILIDAGLVHVLGTDAHTPHAGRQISLRAELAALGAHAVTAPHLTWIAEGAPRAIIRGEDVEAPFSPRV